MGALRGDLVFARPVVVRYRADAVFRNPSSGNPASRRGLGTARRLTAGLVVAAILLAAGSARADVFYVYDDLSRLIAVVDQQGNAATYTYDAVGNLLQIERFDAAQQPGPVRITLVAPSRGKVGAQVQVFGTGFDPTPALNTLAFTGAPATVTEAAPTRPGDEATRALLHKYVRAWEAADVDGLVALLKEEAVFTMPPSPSWYRGRAPIGAFVAATIFGDEGMFPGQAAGRWRLMPARANAQPAFALYERDPSGGYRAFALQVLTFDGDQLAEVANFIDAALFARFGLPAQLEA